MTDNEIKYETNAATCRATGHFIEVQIAEWKLYELLDDHVKMTLIDEIITQAENDLDPIYDEQIRLFDIVTEERRLAKIEAKRIACHAAFLELRGQRILEVRRFELTRRTKFVNKNA